MRAPLVVGVDAGATSTRCVVATLDGTVLGRGHAAGANQNSSGGRPADALAAAISQATEGQRTEGRRTEGRRTEGRIAFGVVGAAGAAAAGRAEARAAAEEAWRAAGLPGEVRSVTDLEVAFAAGTPRREGLLLLAGTGAAAVAFRDGVPYRRCDGYGWLLGDEGSAVWQGREALRAVLRALDGRGPATRINVSEALTETASETLNADDPQEQAQSLIRVAYRRPPAALGLLAPLVGRAAREGDAVALGIVEQAAAHLLHALDTVARGGSPPVVLAGSVLLTGGPVADLVRRGVEQRFGVVPVEARDGAAGAAVLAIAALTGAPVDNAVHAKLTASGNDFVNI